MLITCVSLLAILCTVSALDCSVALFSAVAIRFKIRMITFKIRIHDKWREFMHILLLGIQIVYLIAGEIMYHK